MELMIFIVLFIVIVIMARLSSIENQLSSIEKSLRVGKRGSFKSESPISIPEKSVPKKIIPKKTVFKKPVVQKSVVKELLTQEPSFTSTVSPSSSSEISLEELFLGNIVLKVAIIAFILGIGLFLKYSIDRDWIPMWMRIFTGVMVGVGMLSGGIKMINNSRELPLAKELEAS